ncbi:Nep-interacting protein [Thalictrum thalictroides]|uniref:Nep-interacting protein n=1 Tax=Thalictrum thalictroides TaxID=46969 RepID=A0A7J6VAU0_THATH|nr:Nep-interacting protein [Thalictrum thalictroides]
MAWMSFITLLLAVLFLTLNHNGVVGGRSTLSSEEQLEHNKIVVTEFGHTYDCVDIQQQPALSHPQFKNYKVQMEPSFSLKQSIGKTSPLHENSEATISRVDCPRGTVPIRRTDKEHLDRMKSFAELYDSSIHPQTKDQPGRQFAILKSYGRKHRYHGIQSYINVQQPFVNYDQLSASQLWIEVTVDDEFNSLQAGWIVYPELYRDNLTHFFSYYKIIKAGIHRYCFNAICSPGFVQVSATFPVDAVISPISVYAGEQREIFVYIQQDRTKNNWWLKCGNEFIGYWPESLVPQLARDGASYVAWGGFTKGPPGGPSPPMGNGKPFNWWMQQYQFQSYFYGLKIVNPSNYLEDIKDRTKYISNQDCYGLRYIGPEKKGQVNVIYLGGTGGNCGV